PGLFSRRAGPRSFRIRTDAPPPDLRADCRTAADGGGLRGVLDRIFKSGHWLELAEDLGIPGAALERLAGDRGDLGRGAAGIVRGGGAAADRAAGAVAERPVAEPRDRRIRPRDAAAGPGADRLLRA